MKKYKVIKEHPFLSMSEPVSLDELEIIFTSTGIESLLKEGFIEEIRRKKWTDEDLMKVYNLCKNRPLQITERGFIENWIRENN